MDHIRPDSGKVARPGICAGHALEHRKTSYMHELDIVLEMLIIMENCWKDEEVMQWKTNYVSSCNAVSVAVGAHLP